MYLKTKLKNSLQSYADRKLKEKINSILNRPIKDKLCNSELGENEFRILQTKYKARDGYKYDRYNTWLRGICRAKEVINIDEIFKGEKLSILELCCGDGMVGKILNDYGHNVDQHDIDDWRDFRSKGLKFYKQDLTNCLSISGKKYDLIFSFNSFEHIPNPTQTLSDIKCHLRTGGYVYLEFGPLYNSPWGLHIYKTIFMPYPQFLFSADFINSKVAKLGINDLGGELLNIQPLNKWSYQRFEALWKESGFQLISKEVGKDFSCLNVIKEYPNSFLNKGLDLDEISTQWIRVVLKK